MRSFIFVRKTYVSLKVASIRILRMNDVAIVEIISAQKGATALLKPVEYRRPVGRSLE